MPERNFTDADIEALVDALKVSHQCSFSEEERQIIHDMANGGRIFKKAIIYLLVGLALWAVLAKSAILKLGQVMGLVR